MKVNPIYLRYVAEGLGDQTVLPEPESLPYGLESLFAEWIRPCQRYSSDEMQVLWGVAVLRDPFSVTEISSLTGLPSGAINGVIQNHPHLFNRTPEGGYALFHERFKVFVLGTSSHHELRRLHGRISQSLLDIIMLHQQAPASLLNYAYRQVSHHCLCTGKTPSEMIDLFNHPKWMRSFEKRCPGSGWFFFRVNIHQVRIHQRYKRNEEIIETLLHECRLSLQYDGPDVLYQDGGNELKIDHEFDFIIYAVMALLHAQKEEWAAATSYLSKSSEQILEQWGTGTLTEVSNGKDPAPYYIVLNVLEQLTRVAVEKDRREIAFQTLKIIDQYSWENATRVMMAACCRCCREDIGIELLRFLAQHHWNKEEEHPLEVAAKWGAYEIVMEGEEFVEIDDFQFALYHLIVSCLNAKEYSKANPLFARLMATAKSAEGLAPIFSWTMVVSILGRSQVPDQKLNGAVATLERYLENESAKEFHAWNIVNECRGIDRLAPWVDAFQLKHGFTFEEQKFQGMLPATTSKDENYIESKRQLNQAFPGFLASSEPYIVPDDWPKRGFCGDIPPSMALTRVGLILEWHVRKNPVIQAVLGLKRA
jgi:hypothetical protein